jgi:uncharacterized membrane protein
MTRTQDQENHMEVDFKNAPSLLATEGQTAWTYVIYGLHAVSALGGLLSPAFIVTAFISGWPSIIAVIINYAIRAGVRNTYLESHFRWQIRTFWFALLWVMVALLLMVTFIGIPFAFIIAWGAGLWVMYRIVRGLLRLLDQKPMPQ